MKKYKLLIILNIFIMLGACDKPASTQDKLFETQRNALDQAKQLESKVQQQAQELQKNLEKQEQ